MLHILLALDRGKRGRMDLKIDELMDSVALGKAGNEAVAMFIDATNQIVRYANVDRAAGPACEDINVELSHPSSMPKRDGRDKPGLDERKRMDSEC